MWPKDSLGRVGYNMNVLTWRPARKFRNPNDLEHVGNVLKKRHRSPYHWTSGAKFASPLPEACDPLARCCDFNAPSRTCIIGLASKFRP